MNTKADNVFTVFLLVAMVYLVLKMWGS